MHSKNCTPTKTALLRQTARGYTCCGVLQVARRSFSCRFCQQTRRNYTASIKSGGRVSRAKKIPCTFPGHTLSLTCRFQGRIFELFCLRPVLMCLWWFEIFKFLVSVIWSRWLSRGFSVLLSLICNSWPQSISSDLNVFVLRRPLSYFWWFEVFELFLALICSSWPNLFLLIWTFWAFAFTEAPKLLSFLNFCFHWFATACTNLFLVIWAFWAFEPTQHTIILLVKHEAQSSKWRHQTEQTCYRILVRQLAKASGLSHWRSKKQLRKSAMKAQTRSWPSPVIRKVRKSVLFGWLESSACEELMYCRKQYHKHIYDRG